MPIKLLMLLFLACTSASWQPSLFPWDTYESIGYSLLSILAMWMGFIYLAQRTRLQLIANRFNRYEILKRFRKRQYYFSLATWFLFGLILFAFGWGAAIEDLCTFRRTAKGGFDLPTVAQLMSFGYPPDQEGTDWKFTLFPGTELIMILPFLLLLFGSWFFFYDAERQIDECFRSRDDETPFWSRSGYVFYRSRQLMVLVLFPILLFILQQGFARTYPELASHPVVSLISILSLPMIVLFFPVILPFALGVQPIPPGEIRENLEQTATRLGFRYRQLYLWNTKDSIANALVVGILARWRYVIFTDRLLKNLNREELDAVLGHEVGHARYGHLIYYTLFLWLSVMLLGGSFSWIVQALDLKMQNLEPWFSIFTILGVGLYIFLVFGFLSRRCERQADLFGCRANSCANPYCDRHTSITPLVPEGKALCSTGIQYFIQALERVEFLNQGYPDSESENPSFKARLWRKVQKLLASMRAWQHSTIQKRVAYLDFIRNHPDEEAKFQRYISRLRLIILGMLFGAILVIGLFGGWDLFF